MKKLSKVLAVAVFALTPILISGSSVQAQASCDVGFTGPDSQNLCTSVTQYECSVTNTNTVTIINENNQVVASGAVTNSGNTQGGNGTSGSVTNSSGTTFSVTITNTAPESETPGTCVAAVTVPAVEDPETPVQPTNGGGGATADVVLPHTNDNSVLTVLLVTVGSLAVLTTAGVAGVALYRYYKSL